MDGDGDDDGPVPIAFVAVTAKVYRSRLVRPVIVHDSGPGIVAVHVSPPLAVVVRSVAVAE